jgi:hypothetical protein
MTAETELLGHTSTGASVLADISFESKTEFQSEQRALALPHERTSLVS